MGFAQIKYKRLKVIYLGEAQITKLNKKGYKIQNAKVKYAKKR